MANACRMVATWAFSREIRPVWRHRLELDEVPQALNFVEVDPNLFPKEQVTFFCDHDFDPERARQSQLQLVYMLDTDYPVATLALFDLIRALVRDQMRRCTLLLPELQAAVRNMKVSVTLDQYAMVLST